MSVRRAQREIDAAEFAEWIAYNRVDPIGGWRSDLNAAMICWVTACANYGGKGKRPKIGDFMPDFGDEDKDRGTTPESMKTILRAASSAMNTGKSKGTG